MFFHDARDALGQLDQGGIASVEPSSRPQANDKFCRVASPACADVERKCFGVAAAQCAVDLHQVSQSERDHRHPHQ